MLVAAELVVERHDGKAAEKGGGCSDEPAWLIAHEDGDAGPGSQVMGLEQRTERTGVAPHVEIRPAASLGLSPNFDQCSLGLKLHECVGQEVTDTRIGSRPQRRTG